MSATTTWKCPNDGLEWSVKERRCPTCGYVNMPKCVALTSAKTGKSAELGATMRFGMEILKQRFADDEAQFAAKEQFEIVRDTDRAAWVIRPLAGAKNKTLVNGTEVPETGHELAEGDVITIGKTKMKLTVKLK